MKKAFFKSTSVVMVSVLLFFQIYLFDFSEVLPEFYEALFPVVDAAVDQSGLYIADLILVSADNVTDAKTLVAEQGFAVSEVFDSGSEGKFMCLGYKKTNDKASAIRAVRFARSFNTSKVSDINGNYCIFSIAGGINVVYASYWQTIVSTGSNSHSYYGTDYYYYINGKYQKITDDDTGENYLYVSYDEDAGEPITSVKITARRTENGYYTATSFENSKTSYNFSNNTENSLYLHYCTVMPKDEDLSAQEILEKYNFDINKVLSNISFSDGKIKGPSVEILGKEVCLFEFDASVDLPILNNSSMTVDPEKKTINILIGVKDTQSATVSGAQQKTKYWSEAYQDVKKMYQNVTGKKVDTTKLWNDYSSLRGSLKKLNASMGFSCDASLAGYIEFSFASGKVKFSSGGVITELNFNTTLESRWVAFPAAYVTFGLSLGVGAEIKVEYLDTVYFSGEINGNVKGLLGVGLGEKNWSKTYIEGRLEADVSLSLDIPIYSLKDSLAIGMSGTFFVEAYGLGFEIYNDNFPFLNVSLYPEFANNRSRKLMKVNSNSSNVVLLDRDYETDISSLNLSDSFVKEDIFAYNAPVLVHLNDGKLMLVWVDDDGTKDVHNRTSIYYSLYENSVWSKPAPININDGYNDNPVVYSDGEKVHIVWQRTEKLDENSDYETVLNSVHLAYSCFDGEKFTEAITLANSFSILDGDQFVNACEVDYSLYTDDTNVYINYFYNSKNDIFYTTGTSYLNCAVINKQTSEISYRSFGEIDTKGGRIEEVCAVTSEEEQILYYTVCKNDVYYLYKVTKKDSVYELQSILSSMDKIYSLSIVGDCLYFIVDNTLMQTEISGGGYRKSGISQINNYTIITEKGEIAKLITLVNSADGDCQILISEYTGHKWGEFYTAYSTDGYIRNYSPLQHNGDMYIAINSVEYNDSPETEGLYGAASLCVVSEFDYFDISLGNYLDCDEELLKNEGLMRFDFEVTNDSCKSVSELQIICENAETGETIEKIITCNLEAGKTEKLQVEFEAFENISYSDIFVYAYSPEFEEMDTTNNKLEAVIGYADLNIADIQYFYVDRVPYVKVFVDNTGLGNISNAEILLKTEENIVVDNYVVDIESESAIAIEIPSEFIKASENANVSLRIELTSDYIEDDYENNIVYILYSDYCDNNPTYECLNHTYVREEVSATCTTGGYIKLCCDVCFEIEETIEIAAMGHSDKDYNYYCDNCDELLVKEENQCSHLCHSRNEFLKFIWQIVKFFSMIFGVNPVCPCGISHY